MEESETQYQSLALTLQDEGKENSMIIRRVVTIGCCVNAVLMTLKLLAGYLGHSDALVADGFHSLNDILSDIIMFIFVGISYRKADKKYTYGYGKFGTFSSFLMSVLLIVISAFIFIEGVESIIEFSRGTILPQPDIWTFIVILFAMACKEGLYHFYSKVGKKTESKALVANAWHHRSDALASIATLIGVTFAHFFGTVFRVLDPIASLIISIFIFVPAVKLFVPSFLELMDRSLPKSDIDKAESIILTTDEVKGIKFLRSRRNGHLRMFDIGIYINGNMSIKDIDEISDKINNEFYNAFCPHAIINISVFPLND